MIPYGNAKQQNAKVQLYYIPEESLEAWMRNRTSWMLWSVDDVVDPFWKSIAIEIRESVSGIWALGQVRQPSTLDPLEILLISKVLL